MTPVLLEQADLNVYNDVYYCQVRGEGGREDVYDPCVAGTGGPECPQRCVLLPGKKWGRREGGREGGREGCLDMIYPKGGKFLCSSLSVNPSFGFTLCLTPPSLPPSLPPSPKQHKFLISKRFPIGLAHRRTGGTGKETEGTEGGRGGEREGGRKGPKKK